MEIIGDPNLGPARVALGPITKLRVGKAVLAQFVVLGIIGLGIFAFAPMLTGYWVTTDAWGLATGFGAVTLLSLFAVAQAVAGIVQTYKLSVTIHDNGLSITQSWFKKKAVSWSAITGMQPPTGAGIFHAFRILSPGRNRMIVNRLCIKPSRGPHGEVVQHPDVQIVLDHYENWRQQYRGHLDHQGR